MGLGTKIKEAMHGDKETHQSPTSSTHNAPGAYPGDDVPRTYKQGNTHGDTAVPSAGEPRTERLHGKHSPDYTYGAGKDSTLAGTGSHGVASERHEGGLGRHDGMTNTTGTTGTQHNKLTKDSPHPTTSAYGSGVGGTLGRTHNDGLAAGSTGVHGTHAGAAGTGASQEPYGTHNTTDMTGSTGMTGNTHGTGMTGSTHGASNMTGNNYGTGMTGNTHGTPGVMTGATGTHDNRYDDRINSGPTTGSTTRSGPGMTSNMTHRPADATNMHRDHKVDEYDAPTNSSGRGKQGLAGAAGGVAASELANRHHKDDMRDYHGNDRGLNTAERWHNSSPREAAADAPMGNTTGAHSGVSTGPMGGNTSGVPHSGGAATGHHGSGSMLDPYGDRNMVGGAAPTSGTVGNSSSMLDPHNNTSRTTYGHDHSHPSVSGAAGGVAGGMAGNMAANEYGAGPNSGMTGTHGGPHDTARGVPHDATMNRDTMGTAGSGYGPNTSSPQNSSPMGSGMAGGMANSLSSGMGDGHHGPGHAGAKVLHRCDHCGNDNDISKYFSKEAAYRMS